jgi:hypothetical protein
MALGRSENLVGPGTATVPAGTRWNVWAGRVLSALPVLAMVASAAMKLARPPQVVEAFTVQYGYPANTLAAIAVVELACALLYVIPRTAVLGAMLVTAYLGGAVATHVRAAEPFVIPVLLGVAAWAGLYLRDRRLHPLLPLRRAS